MGACRSGKSRARTSPVRAAASREPPFRVSLNERGRLWASARPTPEYVRSQFPKECRRNWTFQTNEKSQSGGDFPLRRYCGCVQQNMSIDTDKKVAINAYHSNFFIQTRNPTTNS